MEMKLGRRKRNRKKPWSKPCSWISPFATHHDMEDRDDIEEGITKALGKDTSRTKS